MKLTDELSKEYARLFRGAQLGTGHLAAIDKIADRSVRNQARYETVAAKVGMPWYLIATIHSLEAGQGFKAHLHNGDPLSARTVKVPKGRPRSGAPPFTWETSAIDALRGHDLHEVPEWTLPVMLFQLEKFNGFGYRLHHPEVKSPYLWSFTSVYKKGKFVGDGVFSATTVSKQCGAAALLKRLAARKDIKLPGAGGAVTANAAVAPTPVAAGSAPPFPGTALRRGVAHGRDVCRVQERLRKLGFAIDKVDGCPFGPQTETAVIAFQRTHGLRPSGRVGRDTWKALFG
jgi:lysozyme family protein